MSDEERSNVRRLVEGTIGEAVFQTLEGMRKFTKKMPKNTEYVLGSLWPGEVARPKDKEEAYGFMERWMKGESKSGAQRVCVLQVRRDGVSPARVMVRLNSAQRVLCETQSNG